MESKILAVKFVISGRVQGVGFRWFVKRIGERLGLDGYVRNLFDGQVEALAEGPEDMVAKFRKEITLGPGFSVVTEVKEYEVEPKRDRSGFNVTF